MDPVTLDPVTSDPVTSGTVSVREEEEAARKILDAAKNQLFDRDDDPKLYFSDIIRFDNSEIELKTKENSDALVSYKAFLYYFMYLPHLRGSIHQLFYDENFM